MKLALSHWYPGPGGGLIVSIPDLCSFSYFDNDHIYRLRRNIKIADRVDAQADVQLCNRKGFKKIFS